jgi:hypothetical protein
VAYILEYKNASSSEWLPIRQSGNPMKRLKPIIQVSEIRIITSLKQPSIDYSTNCAQEVMCSRPINRYEEGQMVGPLIIRIRVFA